MQSKFGNVNQEPYDIANLQQQGLFLFLLDFFLKTIVFRWLF